MESIPAALAKASYSDRFGIVRKIVEDEILRLLNWDNSRRGDLQNGLFHVGLDSLHSVELQFQLEQALGYTSPDGHELVIVPDIERLAQSVLNEWSAYHKVDAQ